MLKIFNSLSKRVEQFEPFREVGGEREVGLYACGPTVYDFPHIGHGRKYVNDDVLRRVLENVENLKVKHVQNITDVGHLVSDADEGEDKLEKGAKKYGKTVWEVAEEYTKVFFEEMDMLNIKRPSVSCKATDHITEQIEMIKKLVDKGFAYVTEEAVYFEVSKFPEYGKLFGQKLDDKLVGVRDEVVTETSKRNPLDFALWFKRVGKYSDHVMHWESPWGDGFPGWHIECSAMSIAELGEQFEIHTGGEDHLSIHHPNEIAQSEAATGRSPFVKYWFHSAFLTVDGKKMSKSLGNVYRVSDIVEKGFSPMALRYLYLSTHYRKTMNFTWEALEASQTAWVKLNKFVTEILETGKLEKKNKFYESFVSSVEDDLNMAGALAVAWEVVKSDLEDGEKKSMILEFDKVLGLQLGTYKEKELTDEVSEMLILREKYRSEKNWVEADKIRDRLMEMGVEVKDK